MVCWMAVGKQEPANTAIVTNRMQLAVSSSQWVSDKGAPCVRTYELVNAYQQGLVQCVEVVVSMADLEKIRL